MQLFLIPSFPLSLNRYEILPENSLYPRKIIVRIYISYLRVIARTMRGEIEF